MRDGAARSSSAPARPRPRQQTDDDDEATNFPPLLTYEDVPDLSPGWWTRQALAPRSSRQSRASSIVSTRTRFSTTTLDEVRSIEINAGGNTYRISRDGSHITDVSAPPPYTGYHSPEDNDSTLDAESGLPSLPEDDQEDIPPEQEPRKRVRIVLPGEDDEIHVPGASHQDSTTDRLLTKADLYQIILDLPLMLKQALGLKSSATGGLSRSVTLPSTLSAVNGYSDELTDTGNIQESSRKARPHSSDDILLSRPPFHKNTTSSVPSSFAGLREQSFKMGSAAESRSSTDSLRSIHNSDGDHSVHMTVGDLNELSVLYNGVIRDLDREHRRKLHERDKEMERLRSLLNEQDIIYRQQLKAKDFIIEDQRAKLALQEDEIERRIEKARNEVEDDWERRWKVQEGRLIDRFTKSD